MLSDGEEAMRQGKRPSQREVELLIELISDEIPSRISDLTDELDFTLTVDSEINAFRKPNGN